MYRRILVPVDGSATSKLGLRHALGLAKDQHARIRVVNVLDDLALAPMNSSKLSCPSLFEAKMTYCPDGCS